MLDKKYLKRVGLYIGGTALAIGMACYIGYHLWQSVSREIETVPAVPEDYSVTAEYDAWVFRDEVAVTSSGTGTAVASVRDGEKVSKTSVVAQIYSSAPAEKVSELETVRNQIRLLEGKHSTTVSGDMGIGDVMLDLSSSVKNGQLDSAAEISSRLTALASARASGGGETSALIASLEAKEQEILSSLGTSSGTVYTPYSGWYYGAADGYESVFTPDAVIDISPDGLEAILATEPADVSTAAGRIVRTYKWYIAVNMDASDGSSFAEGDVTEITVPGVADPLELTVESVVNGTGNRTAVVFSCGTIPEGVDMERHLTVEFTIDNVTGFGIPKEAVRFLDGVTGVYTYNGVVIKFRKIEIIAEYDEIYIAAVHEDEIEEIVPIVTETGTATGEADVTTAPILGAGTGRKDYSWLSPHEFIVVKGKSLYHGRVVG